MSLGGFIIALRNILCVGHNWAMRRVISDLSINARLTSEPAHPRRPAPGVGARCRGRGQGRRYRFLPPPSCFVAGAVFCSRRFIVLQSPIFFAAAPFPAVADLLCRRHNAPSLPPTLTCVYCICRLSLYTSGWAEGHGQAHSEQRTVAHRASVKY